MKFHFNSSNSDEAVKAKNGYIEVKQEETFGSIFVKYKKQNSKNYV